MHGSWGHAVQFSLHIGVLISQETFLASGHLYREHPIWTSICASTQFQLSSKTDLYLLEFYFKHRYTLLPTATLKSVFIGCVFSPKTNL